MVLGDKSQLKILGSGVVPFKMETGHMMQVHDVLFVLGLRYNVLPILMMDKKGFEVLFWDGKVRLKHIGSKSDGVVLGVR